MVPHFLLLSGSLKLSFRPGNVIDFRGGGLRTSRGLYGPDYSIAGCTRNALSERARSGVISAKLSFQSSTGIASKLSRGGKKIGDEQRNVMRAKRPFN